MDVTIHRGAKEIGGSLVEVSAGGTRLILDAGMPLVDEDRQPFDSKDFRGKSIEELIAVGIVPDVPGLFRGSPRPDAILLSHSHIDHAGLLHLTQPGIKIHATKGASQMMLAGDIFAGQERLAEDRFEEVQPGKPFDVGAFRITPFAVDHSTYGCVAYLLEADGKTLLYSGDLRWHGRKPELIEHLATQIARRSIDALLMEGTHVGSGRGKGKNEYQLETEILGTIKDARKLVLASFSPQDVDRLITYVNATRDAGRIFVADAYAAFVMHLLTKDPRVPTLGAADHIRVYWNASYLKKRNRGKLDAGISKARRIELDEILAAPQHHVMVFRPSMTALDFGDRLPAGCRCIYSAWRGYLEKQDWVDCQRKVSEAGGDFLPRHTSGHIYEEDLVELVRRMNPKRVIPIHTFEPQGFLRHFPNATPFRDGERSPIA
jgi:ribonuclease J